MGGVAVDFGKMAQQMVGSVSHSHFAVWKEVTLKAAPEPTWSSPVKVNSSPEVGLGLAFIRNSGPRARCLVGGFLEGTILGAGERGEETTDLRPPGEELMRVIASLRWSSHHQSPDGESQQGSPWGP